jgi:aldose 1-epimerase
MPFEAIVKTDQEYPVIILKDLSNGTEAEIYALGGLLNAFRVLSPQGSLNCIEGFGSVEDARRHITNGFKSAKLSPFVCRMRHGSYTLANQDYRIKKYYLGDHAIHGLVFDLPFTVSSVSQSDTHAEVQLSLQYDGADKGFPFPYLLQVGWKLEAGNKLTVSTAVSHQNAMSIPYTDGWHPYFTLGGTVDEWILQFSSNGQLEYDAELLPTGKKFEDSRFENGCSLKGIELDNSFELAAETAGCVLANNKIRLHIEPIAGYPILQVYIPPQRKSIAIENLSGPPDNFNNGMDLLLLAPGEKKTFITSYRVEIL